jgi:hypothetical protein
MLSKGIFNLAGDANIVGNGTLQTLSGGLLEKTAGTSAATVSAAVLDNEGEVEVTKGTLVVSSAVDQIFSNILTGGIWYVSGTSGTAALDLTASSSNFNTIGMGTSVTLNGKYASFANLSNLIANQGSFSLLGGQAFTPAGSFTDSGSLTLGPVSTLSVNGTFLEASGATLTVQMGGTNTSPTFGSVTATQGVTLAGGLTVTSSVTPVVGSSFEIVNNTSSSAISGAFAGLPEGSTFSVKVGSKTMTFQITYKGGTGNDVVLTRTA